MNSSTDPREEPNNKACCGYNDCLDILRELPIFNGVPLDVVKVLAYLSGKESFTAGEILCEQGDPIDRCQYLLCGEVEMTHRNAETTCTLARKGPGNAFGGLGLLGTVKSAYTLRAATDVECLVVTKEKFLKTAERFPEMLPKILANVVGHIFRWEEAFLASHLDECATSGGLGPSFF